MNHRAPPAPAHRNVMALDIGGSHATAARVSRATGSYRIREFETAPVDPTADVETLLDALAAPARRLLALLDDDVTTYEWVVAMPGPFDYESGIGAFDGVGKFEALRGIAVGTALATRLRARSELVRFVNDAEAYGIGEWAFGETDRVARQVCITLGTGVGSAFLCDGRPIREGDDVPPHGWVHRLSYEGAPLEDTVSTRAISSSFARRTGLTESVKAIAAAARDGDAAAASVLDHAMFALGVTLAPLLSAFRAERLTVGGSMARSWGVLEPALRRGLTTVVADLRELDVRPSRLLDRAPILGAAEWLHPSDPLAPSHPLDAPALHTSRSHLR